MPPGFHHRIVAALYKGMAAQQSPRRFPPSAQHSVALHRLHRKLRAGRQVTARHGQHRRNGPLVGPQHDRASMTCRYSSCSNPGLAQLLRNAAKSLRDFVAQSQKLSFQQRLLRINHYIHRHAELNPCSRTASRRLRFMRLRSTAGPNARPTVKPTLAPSPSAPPQIEDGHMRGEMAASLLVHALKIGVPQKPGAAWKPGTTAASRHIATAVRSVSAHHLRSNSVCGHLSGKRDCYSRKPGFTDTRLRPLARRREMTARPALVFIRVRNPCVFERWRRLGWKVRLGMKCGCS